MENPEGKFGFGFSRIRNGKQQLSGLFLDEDVYSSSAAEPGKLLQSHGAGAEPFHFVMRCQRRRNKRGMKAAPSDAARIPPAFREGPFLSSPLGEFGCENRDFAAAPASPAEDSSEERPGWINPAPTEMEMRLDVAFPASQNANCSRLGQIQLGMWELRFPSHSIKRESGMRSSVSASAAACGTKGRQ